MNRIILLVVSLVMSINIMAQDSLSTKPNDGDVPSTTKVASTSSTSLGNSKGNPLEFGINGGLHVIFGDINSRLKADLNNSTFGAHFRYALSRAFSFRWQYSYGNATMRHAMPHQTAVTNGLNSTDPLWFVASQCYSHTLFWDNIFTVGNNVIKRPSSKVIVNFFAGPALVMYRTKLNYRDDNRNGAIYDWTFADNTYQTSAKNDILTGERTAKKNTDRVLDQLFDDTYETLANNNRVKGTLGKYAVVPGLSFGTSIAFKLAKFMNLEIEERLVYAFDDYLDGERWANYTSVPQYSQGNDMMSNTTVKLNFNLAKVGKEPLYWQNGHQEMMDKLAAMNPRREINAALMDDDGDGVPNALDQEPESREECPVNTKGVMLDSDKDGILDCDDKEPYSPAGYPVDDQGVAQVPPPACCADLVKEIADDVKGVTDAACENLSLPAIQFDKDKYGVNSTMIPSLQTIGERMQLCPDLKLVVNGINDKNNKNGKYNEQLSYNRAMEATNYLAEKFGISRDRFIVRYNLEGSGDLDADRSVVFRPAQLDETGNNNPPSPHPGLKAGSR